MQISIEMTRTDEYGKLLILLQVRLCKVQN